MCFGGNEAKKARQQAQKDAALVRTEMEKDRQTMIAEYEKNRKEMGKLAPPPSSVRTKNPKDVGGVRRKKANRAPQSPSDLRIPLNTGSSGSGSSGGGINVG